MPDKTNREKKQKTSIVAQTEKKSVKKKGPITSKNINKSSTRSSGLSLTKKQKDEILAILTVGCSRKIAARYAGCAPSAISKIAAKDPDFACDLRHAEQQAEISSMKSINAAARQERYWKAAAWILERRNPEEYRLRSPGTFNEREFKFIITQLSEMIVEEVKSPAHRKRLLARIDEFLKNIEEKH
ncbi:MAG: hypothetical protein Q4D17_03625 [Planctomycetia bacterium]|nr:hypothetical protein [Planctomycetia bacterium]